MGKSKYKCPDCKKEFYADDRFTVACPKCHIEIVKVKAKTGLW